MIAPLACKTFDSAPALGPEWAQSAREWRKERDKRSPLKRDIEAERRGFVRDFISEALEPAGNEMDAVFLALANRDDTAAAYHFRRLVVGVKAAAGGFEELASAEGEKAEGA